MARPEGYRKAVRLMEMADRFGIPVLSLVDTAGAYPGIDAEERGQAEAIARSTEACLKLGVPNVAVILGEGGSGGAVAIATANRVLMLEHAIYSVISPEGAASILWRDTTKAQDAATNMKITGQDLSRVRHHRRDRHRAGRRRAPRPGRRHRGDRRGDRERARRAQGPRPRDRAPPAPGQVPRHRPRAGIAAHMDRVPGRVTPDVVNCGAESAGHFTAFAVRPQFYRSFTVAMLNRAGYRVFSRALAESPSGDNDFAMTARGLPLAAVGEFAFEPKPARSRALMASAALRRRSRCPAATTDGALPMSAKAARPLSDKMVAEIESKNMDKESPILIRVFKEESELEVWKQDRTGRFALLKTYPICRWSGELGPKIKEGDRQAPEGFYTHHPGPDESELAVLPVVRSRLSERL